MKMKVLLLTVLILLTATTQAKWRYKESKDEMTDVNTSYTYTMQTSCKKRCAMLVVKNSGEMVLIYNKYLSNEGISVYYRIDDNAQEEILAVPSTTGKAAIIENAHSLINDIAQGSKLLIRVHDYRGVARTVKFDLTGSAADIKKLNIKQPEIVAGAKKPHTLNVTRAKYFRAKYMYSAVSRGR